MDTLYDMVSCLQLFAPSSSPPSSSSSPFLLLAGAWPAAKQVARLPGDYASPAFALWLGAHVWAYLSPHTYHVMQCLAASVPVMAGYAQTKRAAASGRLAAGMLLSAPRPPPPLTGATPLSCLWLPLAAPAGMLLVVAPLLPAPPRPPPLRCLWPLTRRYAASTPPSPPHRPHPCYLCCL